MLIVLTEGELEWEVDGRVDGAQTSALPLPFANALDEEPRYVDLRWARSETQLAQRDARFRAAIADLAAPIHGRSKDDMLGEDVRQHKRTLAVAWTAGTMLAALAIAASITAVLAVQQRDRARTQSNIALSRQLAIESATQLKIESQVGALLALESYRRVVGQSDPHTFDARNEMLQAIEVSPHLRGTMRPPEGPIKRAALSPDGNTLVTSDGTGKLSFFDAHDSRELGRPRAGTGDPLNAMVFSPDGSTLATADDKGLVTLWNVKRLHPQRRLSRAPRSISGLAFSRDGSQLAVAGSDTEAGPSHITIWRTAAPQSPVELPGSASRIRSVAFTPDGGAVITTDAGGRVRLWTRQASHLLRGESGFALATRRDGRVLLLAKMRHGGARIVDALSGEPLGPMLFEDSSSPTAIADDGRVVASADGRGGIDVSNLRGRRWHLESDNTWPLGDMPMLSRDGNELATIYDNSQEIEEVLAWDVRPMPPLATESLAAPRGVSHLQPSSLALGPGGRAVVGDSNGLTFWDGAGQTAIRRRVPHGVQQLAFSPNGRFVAAAMKRGGIEIWSAGRHLVLYTLQGLHRSGSYWALSLAFSADSKELTARTTDGNVAVWDVSNTKPVLKSRTQTKVTPPPPPCRHATPSACFEGTVGYVALASDGTTLVYSTRSPGVKLWKLSGKSLGSANASGGVPVAVAPDGLTVATADLGGGLQLSDIPRKQELGTPLGAIVGVVPGAIAFANDGSRVAWSVDGGVTVSDPIVLSKSFTAWSTRLCRLAGRNLTPSEWSQFLPDARYRKTCPGLP